MPRPIVTNVAPPPTESTIVQGSEASHTSAAVAEPQAPILNKGQAAPPEDDPPYPPFLRQTRGELHSNKFIDLEWQQRHRLASGLQTAANGDNVESPWARLDSASNPEIFRRNRYMNVEPFAANRVRLRVPDGECDYINASYISLVHTVSRAEMHYIATQGPKADSMAHIWRMIFAETGAAADPAVIVMLTQTHEGGKEKCSQYFPFDMDSPTMAVNATDEFSDGFAAELTLESITEDTETRSTIRELDFSLDAIAANTVSASISHPSPATIDNGDEQRMVHKKIHHLLFGGWPDFLVPEGPDCAALLRLIAKSQSLNQPPKNPRIVHCSAGVGRSGTFIALDYLLQEIAEGAWDDLSVFSEESSGLNGNGATAVDEESFLGPNGGSAGNRDSMIGVSKARDPIFECVDSLRKQRLMMVQGEGQYMFLYDVCREVWADRWRSLRGASGP